ncbi:MAG: ArnT family glycosyltransferase [Candidatus Rokuibacteriota bacterium]
MSRSGWLGGLALAAAATALRVIVASRREGIEVDGIVYLGNARALAAGDWLGLTVLHPPGYSVLLAPFVAFASDPEWAARLVSAVLGGLWVLATLCLARETTDERVGWTAAVLVAVMPAAVEAGTRVLAEAAAGLVLTLLLAALARCVTAPSWRSVVAVGLLGGFGVLTRPEGAAYVALAVVTCLAMPRVAPVPWLRARGLASAAAVLGLALSVVLPYSVLIHRETGRWHWSAKMGTTLRFAETVGADRPGALAERAITEEGEGGGPTSLTAWMVGRPGEVGRRIAVNLHLFDRYVIPGLLQTGGIALLTLGVLHLRPRRPPARPEWLLAAAPVTLAGLLLFNVEARYFVPLIPALSIVAALGVARFGARPETPERRRPVTAARVLLVLVLVSWVPWIARPWFREDAGAVDKRAALWLREAAGPGAVFVGRYPLISYYAGARGVPFAEKPLAQALADGRRAGARWVIVDSERLPVSRPDLLGLVAGESRPGLELARLVEDRAGRRVVVYRLGER